MSLSKIVCPSREWLQGICPGGDCSVGDGLSQPHSRRRGTGCRLLSWRKGWGGPVSVCMLIVKLWIKHSAWWNHVESRGRKHQVMRCMGDTGWMMWMMDIILWHEALYGTWIQKVFGIRGRASVHCKWTGCLAGIEQYLASYICISSMHVCIISRELCGFRVAWPELNTYR